MAALSEYKPIYFFAKPRKKKCYNPKNEQKYSGYIKLRIKCVTDLHIGNGYSDFKNSSVLVKETIKYNNKPIIPGSTLKGTVRALARAISFSCTKDNECKMNYEKYTANTCITCDIFGIMGRASKVIFTDFMPENNVKLTVQELNTQFGPSKTKEDGFKFYETLTNHYGGTHKEKAEMISAGSSFTGKVFFKELTEEELSLLMYSLTLNAEKGQGINLKTGGFKNEGKGEIKAESIEFKINNDNNFKKTPEQLAKNYYNFDSAFQDNMDLIEDKMRDGDD